MSARSGSIGDDSTGLASRCHPPRVRSGHPPIGDMAILSAALGSDVLDEEAIPWGDSGATRRLHLADGRDVAARAFDEHHRDDAVRIADAMTDARQAGIPVPNPTLVETGAGIWLVTPWIEGDLGARWLDTPERARVVARVMGELAGDIREIDPALAPLAFVHGDLAPINVVLRADRTVAALLDFEHARVSDPLTDVAWWGWVVRHHHPDAWVAAWPTFCAAAGVDRESDTPALRALMLDELSRRAAAASDDAERARWLERLAEAKTW